MLDKNIKPSRQRSDAARNKQKAETTPSSARVNRTKSRTTPFFSRPKICRQFHTRRDEKRGTKDRTQIQDPEMARDADNQHRQRHKQSRPALVHARRNTLEIHKGERRGETHPIVGFGLDQTFEKKVSCRIKSAVQDGIKNW